jgi:hypothetical protein
MRQQEDSIIVHMPNNLNVQYDSQIEENLKKLIKIETKVKYDILDGLYDKVLIKFKHNFGLYNQSMDSFVKQNV